MSRVQALKAGLLEIADVLVVNKGDRDSADHALKDLRAMLQIAERPAWPGQSAGEGGHEDASEHQDQDEPVRPAPPLVRAVATTGEGTDEIMAALAAARPGTCGPLRAPPTPPEAAAQVLALVSEITADAARTSPSAATKRRAPFYL